MSLATVRSITFERRTSLNPHREYRCDFTQIDNDTLDLLASDEACDVTPSMLKIYVRLYRALRQFQEREGVLWIRSADDETGNKMNAWERLISIVGVANSTAKKALDWMTKKGVIHYEGYKNGYGIRVFFNRAKNSIGIRAENKVTQKILPQPSIPSVDARIPTDGTPFNRSTLDKDLEVINRPPNGGGLLAQVEYLSAIPNAPSPLSKSLSSVPTQEVISPQFKAAQFEPTTTFLDANAVATTISSLVHQTVQQQTERSISHAVTRIRAEVVSDTQHWLDSRGIPKAVRVAMRETFNYQQKHRCENRVGENTHDPVMDSGTIRAECDQQDAADLFASQVECVRLSLESGRTPEQIRSQFNLDSNVWMRALNEIDEQNYISLPLTEFADEPNEVDHIAKTHRYLGGRIQLRSATA
jgi:hypothetical protein